MKAQGFVNTFAPLLWAIGAVAVLFAQLLNNLTVKSLADQSSKQLFTANKQCVSAIRELVQQENK